MDNYYSDDDSLQRSQGTIDGPAFQRPQEPQYQRPWYAGTDSRDERTGVEMEQARRRQADQAGVSPNDPAQRLLRFGVVGSGGAGPQGVPSPRDMPKALAAESQARVFGPTAYRSGDANPNSVYGQGSVRTPNGIGSFAENGQTYNVGATSQDNIRRVTGGKLNSPLFTNIDPSQAIAGLNNQMIGQPADEARLGLDRYQRANDIRGQMIANRDKDIPTGGYGPGILGDMGGGRTQTDLDNEEKTRRWAREDVLKMAKREPNFGHFLAQMYHSDATRDVNANNVAGRMDELGLQGRNQLAAYGLQGQNQLANTRLSGELQGENQLGLERFKQSDPKSAAMMQYYTQLGDQAGATAEKARDELKFGKSLDGQYYKGLEQVSKLMNSGLTAQAEKLYRDLTEAYAFRQHQAKKNAAPESYAGGGSVDAQHEADMRRRYEKAGLVYPGAPAPVQQVPVQQVPVQQVPAPQQSWTDRLRGVATGGLDKRMQNYAQGGGVDVSGRQVFGVGSAAPTGPKSDTIPAVIDGTQPAALDHGEYVIPAEVVRKYGTDFFDKLLAKSKQGEGKGLDTGRNSA